MKVIILKRSNISNINGARGRIVTCTVNILVSVCGNCAVHPDILTSQVSL